MDSKRRLEVASALALLIVVTGLLGLWLRQKNLDEALIRELNNAPFDRQSARVVHRLLDRGARIQVRRADGFTVLMLAAKVGDPVLVRRALDAGLDVNARTQDGHTALMSAAGSRDETLIRLLLRAGADVNARDNEGRTPLMWAAWLQSRTGLRVLLDHGAAADARTRKGHTALTYVGRHPGLIELLERHGAKKSANRWLIWRFSPRPRL